MITRRRFAGLLALPALFAALALLPIALLGGSTPVGAEARPGTVPASQPAYDPDGALVLRVYFRGEAERIAISQEYGHEALPTPGGYLLILADRPAYDSLRARGLRVEIDVDATYQAQQPIPFGGNGDTFFNGYHTVEEMQQFLDAKVAARPTLAQKVDIGNSWCKTHPGQCTQPNTYNGYDIWAMRVTNQSIPGPKPVFWFNAGLHSREIVPPELAMLYISWLLDGYDTNADARYLVDHHEIWIVPMSNPDGHHIVEAGTPTPYTQRKNADKDDGCTGWPPQSGSQFGTDLNRNFPFMWGCCGGSSGSPCNLTYRGPAQGSEEETQAISGKVRELIPDQRGPKLTDAAPLTTTGVFLDMHSAAALNLYPWGQTFDLAPNNDDLRNIAKHLNSPDVGGNGYETYQSVGLYPTDGASDDWAYGERGPAAFTVELLSGNTFFPPTTTIAIDWDANRNPLIHLSKIAQAPYLLTRGPDTSNVASTPMTVTQGTPAALTASINYDWSLVNPSGTPTVEPNTYLQNVAAAEYYVDTPPWAGGTPLPMQAADGNFDSPTELVQVSVPTGSLASGRHVLLVRGRGVNDYEGHQSWGTLSAAFLDVLPPSGATWTPTPIAPIPTPTFGPPCGVLPQSASTTCQAPSSYNYSFGFYNESGCQNTATGTATLTFDVATAPGGPFTVYDTFTRTVSFPPGPSYVTFTGTLTIDNIPAQYSHYRISFSAANVRPNAYGLTPTNAICRVAGPTVTATSTPTISPTGTPTTTPTSCTVEFADVPATNTFYPFVRCLACQGIVSGYPCGGTGEPCNPDNDPYFRPNAYVTRGQLAKIVSESAGFTEPVPATQQSFQDVVYGSTFWVYIERIYTRSVVSGYQCGTLPSEPCVPPEHRPYFRPNAGATRGQLVKIVVNAAGLEGQPPPTLYTFADVPPSNTFWFYVELLLLERPGVMSGYPCGTVPNEPCDSENRPYFRPNNPLTRGQTSKIVASTFFPGCDPPARK